MESKPSAPKKKRPPDPRIAKALKKIPEMSAKLRRDAYPPDMWKRARRPFTI